MHQSCKYPKLVCVRTDTWKYIHYFGEDGELYNLKEDPLETRNLFNISKYHNIITELKSRLLDWFMLTSNYSSPDRENSYFSSYFLGADKAGKKGEDIFWNDEA